VEELPPRYHEYAHPALAHLERALFADRPAADPPPLDGAVRFLEGPGGRATLELVAEELLALLRDGTPPERIAVVCPSLDPLPRPARDGVSPASASPTPWRDRSGSRTPAFGQALLSMLRFAWLGGERRDPLRLPALRRSRGCRARAPTT